MHSTPPSSTLDVKELTLPAPGTWRLDPGHAEVGFVGRHFMINKVRGRFLDVEATVEIGERHHMAHVEAVIRMSSVDSGNATRDEHLRSRDLFDADCHPTATFRSTHVDWDGTSGTLIGDLTLRGATHPIALDVDFLGAVVDPWGAERAVFDAHGRIDREDWGISWNMALESGGLLVSKDIELVVHVELVRQ